MESQITPFFIVVLNRPIHVSECLGPRLSSPMGLLPRFLRFFFWLYHNLSSRLDGLVGYKVPSIESMVHKIVLLVLSDPSRHV